MTEQTALTKRQRLEGTLLSKGFSDRYHRALPAQLREKMSINQAAVTICRAADKNPRILECSPNSIMESLLDAATLGLELAGPMHHAALVPYGSTCQMQIEYPGLIELMYRTGKVESVKVGVVHENDRWSFNQAGTQPPIHEVPWDNRGEPIGVYAIVYLKAGGFTPVVMSKSEVEAHRDKFALKHGKLSPAWTGSFWAMAQKTALRMVSKWIPKSKELADAIQMVDAELAGDQVHVALDLQPDPPPEADEPASRADQIRQKLSGDQDDQPIEAQFTETPDTSDAMVQLMRWADNQGVPFPEVVGMAQDVGIQFTSNNAPDIRTCTKGRISSLQAHLERFIDAMVAKQGPDASDGSKTA